MKTALALPISLFLAFVAVSAQAQWNVLQNGQVVGSVSTCGTPTPEPTPDPDPEPTPEPDPEPKPDPEPAPQPREGDDVSNETVGGKVGQGVDIGLSVEWARWNLGGDSEKSYGVYFSWAETDGTKVVHDWEGYKWIAEGSTDRTHVTKYHKEDQQFDAIWYDGTTFVGDGRSTIEPQDDAATANWGGTWRMPTAAEVEELVNSCTWTWTDDYDGSKIAGCVVTGLNGNSIFMPAAGNVFKETIGMLGYVGNYWASSLGTVTDNAVSLEFNATGQSVQNTFSRYNGFSVRAVRPK